jgi:hypothetical protein
MTTGVLTKVTIAATAPISTYPAVSGTLRTYCAPEISGIWGQTPWG